MPTQTLVIAAALIGLAIVTATLIHGWNGWLAQRGRALERHPSTNADPGPTLASCTHVLARIEMADLRERVRKLEAVAAGIDV